jgi:hypothetical protein
VEVIAMPKSKPFTIRLSEEVEGWLERENRRTRLPKSALLEGLAEESIRTRRFPGIGFRGPEHSRRAWWIGTGLDVWELVELHEGKGKERLLSAKPAVPALTEARWLERVTFPLGMSEEGDLFHGSSPEGPN